MLGWSFIAVVGFNILVHFSLLVKETYHEIRAACKRKYYCCGRKDEDDDESIKSSKKNLSVIHEEEESLESNFSDKPRGEMIRARKLTESDWDTNRMGGSEGGFDIGAITWADLGRKFMIKRGKKSKMPELDPRSELDSARRSRTLDPQMYAKFRDTQQEYVVSPKDRQMQADLELKILTPQAIAKEEKEKTEAKLKRKRKRHSIAATKMQIYEDSSLAANSCEGEDIFATVDAQIIYQAKPDALEVRRDMFKANVNN